MSRSILFLCWLKGLRETMNTTEKVRNLVGSHPDSPKFVTEAVKCIKTKSEEKGQSITTALWGAFKYATQHVSALIESYHRAWLKYLHKQLLRTARRKRSCREGMYFHNVWWWLWNKVETCCTIHSKTMQSTSVTYCRSPPFFACLPQLDVTRNDCAYTDLPKSSSRFLNYCRTDKHISRERNTGLWNQLSWRSKI